MKELVKVCIRTIEEIVRVEQYVKKGLFRVPGGGAVR